MLGLISALAWGIGDFVAKRTVDRIGPYLTLFYMSLVGAVLLGFINLLPFGDKRSFDLPLLFLNFAASSLGILGYFCLYYGFQVGKLSVVSTLTAAGTMVPVSLSLLILKEWPTVDQFIGIFLIVIGVTLVSLQHPKTPAPACGQTVRTNRSALRPHFGRQPVLHFAGQKGVVPALLSALFFGSYVILIKLISVKTGPLLPVFFVRGMGVVFIGGILLAQKKKFSVPVRFWKYLIFIGMLDALAFLAFTVGMSYTLVAIVAPISSLFTLVTVALARFILNEKFLPHQKWGFFIVMAGVIFISLPA
ncbi:MAG: DMT family transporter [Nitrospirae bacterium]|nr:DMT family transporter [Nitrospirota bacterium]